MKNYTFILDPGHGVNTPGKRSPIWGDGTQLLEYEFNRGVVNKIERMAKVAGIKTYNVSPEVEDIGLKLRCDRANMYMATHKDEYCIYISIHGNGAGVESASGIEVFTFEGFSSSDLVAEEFINAIKEADLGLRLRSDYSDGDGDKESRFYVLKHTAMPAILTENGFFTNEEESKKMMTQDFQYDIAEIHICMMMRVKEKQI